MSKLKKMLVLAFLLMLSGLNNGGTTMGDWTSSDTGVTYSGSDPLGAMTISQPFGSIGYEDGDGGSGAVVYDPALQAYINKYSRDILNVSGNPSQMNSWDWWNQNWQRIGQEPNQLLPANPVPWEKYLGYGNAPIPAFFERQQEQFNPLSPVGAMYMSELFENSLASKIPDITAQIEANPYATPDIPWRLLQYMINKGQSPMYTEYEPGAANQLPTQPTELQPGAEPSYGYTALVNPDLMSAQLQRRILETGGMPMLQAYMELMGQDWGQYMQQSKAVQPSEQKNRIPQYAVRREK